MSYEHIRGLNGFCAKDIRKVTNQNLKRTTNFSSSHLKNYQTVGLPIDGRVKDHLKANDHLICDIDSYDIWIRFKL